MTMQWLKASSRYSNGKESDDEYTASVQKGNIWITKETILRRSQVASELGAIQLIQLHSSLRVF